MKQKNLMMQKKWLTAAILMALTLAAKAETADETLAQVLEDCPATVAETYARSVPRYIRQLPAKKADPVVTVKAVVPRACYLELMDWQLQTALQLAHYGLNQGLKSETVSDLTEVLSWNAMAKEVYLKLGRVYEKMQRAGAANEEIAEIFLSAQNAGLMADQTEGYALVYAEARSQGKSHEEGLAAAKAEVSALKKLRGDKVIQARAAAHPTLMATGPNSGPLTGDALWDHLENAIKNGPGTPVQIPAAVQKKGWDTDRLQAFFTSWKGTPYKWGGLSKKGIDCSGFVLKAIESQFPGLKFPHSANGLAAQGKSVVRENLNAGDLVFFDASGTTGRITHVGIFMGENQFAHASSKRGVTLSRLDDKYYVKRFVSARRLF